MAEGVLDDRELSGVLRTEVVEHTAAFAAETGISKPMQRKPHEMLRLARAVRDAGGGDIVDESVLDDIPNYGRSVRAILLRAGISGSCQSRAHLTVPSGLGRHGPRAG
ncbi:hypothetical protein [Streptomyces altiplanensis]